VTLNLLDFGATPSTGSWQNVATHYFSNSSPLAFVNAVSKPGTSDFEGFWFGRAKANSQFSGQTGWTFTQNSALIDKFSSSAGKNDFGNDYPAT
jgi:hypothetical protein